MTLYLYGFAVPGRSEPPEELRGVAGAAVELLPLGPVRAAVSTVPSDDFSEEALEVRVSDLEWIGDQGASHERVVTWFVDHGGILPVRMLTLYSGESALRESVEPRAASLRGRLDELDGLREWDLKISADRKTLRERLPEVSDAMAGVEREMEAATPGRRYLLEQKRARIERDELSRAARDLAVQAYEELAAGAADARRVPLPRGGPGGSTEQSVVLSAAFLVPSDREDESERKARELSGRMEPLGIHVAFTGPWAPYRFLETGDATSADEPVGDEWADG